MAGEEIRATLRGADARLGVVQARDVARLILGLESAVAAAAYAMLGRPRRGTTGRHRSAIEAASRLRFDGIEAGSVVTVLRLPERHGPAGDTFDLDIADVAGAAFDRLVATFDLPDEQVDRQVARTIAELGERLGIGERYDELLLSGGGTQASARLDAAVRVRMTLLAAAPLAQQTDVLVGSLREADFDRRTARLHIGLGEAVQVSFPADLDDQIQEALRGQAQFEGIVTFDPATATARRVDLQAITTPSPLPFDTSDFWQSASVSALAEAQGVGPASFDEPFGTWTDAEREDLAAALADLDA